MCEYTLDISVCMKCEHQVLYCNMYINYARNSKGAARGTEFEHTSGKPFACLYIQVLIFTCEYM